MTKTSSPLRIGGPFSGVCGNCSFERLHLNLEYVSDTVQLPAGICAFSRWPSRALRMIAALLARAEIAHFTRFIIIRSQIITPSRQLKTQNLLGKITPNRSLTRCVAELSSPKGRCEESMSCTADSTHDECASFLAQSLRMTKASLVSA